jgi:hypothetical protein
LYFLQTCHPKNLNTIIVSKVLKKEDQNRIQTDLRDSLHSDVVSGSAVQHGDLAKDAEGNSSSAERDFLGATRSDLNRCSDRFELVLAQNRANIVRAAAQSQECECTMRVGGRIVAISFGARHGQQHTRHAVLSLIDDTNSHFSLLESVKVITTLGGKVIAFCSRSD